MNRRATRLIMEITETNYSALQSVCTSTWKGLKSNAQNPQYLYEISKSYGTSLPNSMQWKCLAENQLFCLYHLRHWHTPIGSKAGPISNSRGFSAGWKIWYFGRQFLSTFSKPTVHHNHFQVQKESCTKDVLCLPWMTKRLCSFWVTTMTSGRAVKQLNTSLVFEVTGI